jgi:protein-tyrosine phosphatase
MDCRILFVCHGNIIRSALAEALFRHHFTARTGTEPVVQSAGIAAIDGRPADDRAAAAARELGVSLDDHRARVLTQQLVDESDLVFIMDRLNEAEIVARFPNARPKLVRLGTFAPDSLDGDVIPDPYSMDAPAVGAAGSRIDRAIRALAEQLAPHRHGTRR